MPQYVRRGDRTQQELINVKRNPYLQNDKDQGDRLRYIQRVPERSKTIRYRDQWRKAGSARRRRTVRRQRIAVGLCGLGVLVLVLIMVFFGGRPAVPVSKNEKETSLRENDKTVSVSSEAQMTLIQGLPAEVYAAHPDWTEDFLTPNEYSRPGDLLERIDNIFVHYTANQGTSAAQNRSYFEQQKDVHERSVSAHFIIGYEGEIIQCVPLDEIAYAVMTRNMDSVSIECCYLEADGSFTQKTYDSLINLLAWLAEAYDLETDDILRHYDCGGKKCPLYYTENPDEWEQLKQDVRDAMEDSGTLL